MSFGDTLFKVIVGVISLAIPIQVALQISQGLNIQPQIQRLQTAIDLVNNLNRAYDYIFWTDGMLYYALDLKLKRILTNPDFAQLLIQQLTAGWNKSIRIVTGDYSVKSTVEIPEFTTLDCDYQTKFINQLSDPNAPLFIFHHWTKVNVLHIDAQNKSGVVIGDQSFANLIFIDWINIYNVGQNTGQFAIKVQGWGNFIDQIHVNGGYYGIINDGSIAELFVNKAILVNCVNGLKITEGIHCYFGWLDIDSNLNIGVDLDNVRDIQIPALTIWESGGEYAPRSLNVGLRIGTNSTFNCHSLQIRGNILGVGNTAVMLRNLTHSMLQLSINNQPMYAPFNNIQVGIDLNNTVKKCHIVAIIDDSITTKIQGTPDPSTVIVQI